MERYRTIIVTLSCFLLIAKGAQAKLKFPTDTIYYLVDTVDFPHGDKKISIITSLDYKFFTIDTTCLKDKTKPTFRVNNKKKAILTNKVISVLKFISQQDLISIVKEHPDSEDRVYDKLFFIIQDKNRFFKYKAHFLGGTGISIMN